MIHGKANAFDRGVRSCEILGDKLRGQADSVEYLRATVRLIGGNAHLGHHLEDTLVDCLDVTLHRLFEVDARRQVAYLPDRFAPPAYLRGKDFIQYMLELHGSSSGSDEIHHMLDALELDRKTMGSSVGSLSKGMTQKLGIACCLLSAKSLLILDEPMSGLDPKARVLFKQQLFRLRERGFTLFFSSHVLADVDELADKMAVLHQSRILFEGTSSDFKQEYNSDNLEDAYINCVNAVDSQQSIHG